MNRHIVYKTINKINGKIYIGVHCTDKDSYMGSGTVIKQAFRKYGVSAFSRKILHKGLTREEAYKIESLIVTEAFLKSTKTYNLKLGGFGGFDHINNSEEATIKRVEASRTTKAKEKRVEAFKHTLAEARKDEAYNKAYLERNKANMVSCVYEDLPEEKKKERNSKISKALRGNTNSDGQWAKDNQSIPIHQYSKEGEFIQTFPSFAEAARQVSGNGPNIKRTVDDPKRSAYGFRWKYKKD